MQVQVQLVREAARTFSVDRSGQITWNGEPIEIVAENGQYVLKFQGAEHRMVSVGGKLETKRLGGQQMKGVLLGAEWFTNLTGSDIYYLTKDGRLAYFPHAGQTIPTSISWLPPASGGFFFILPPKMKDQAIRAGRTDVIAPVMDDDPEYIGPLHGVQQQPVILRFFRRPGGVLFQPAA
ncbi:hypothetical protein [Ktedonospora formicarum]|uniref:Uncharacterized protein n=1 Tax=Ktedonospora formicarum TaxID=2778364 RepID=A0A8J3I3Q4_9CHLR|nr:hypothetical protein [Ktedonospora formicarum]GHO48201.1 hypothetical protein KSX_63640 [Ktedonospora formicarum]